MYNNRVIIHKIKFIPSINGSMIPMNFCKKKSIINFTNDDMTSKLGLFSNIKTNTLYLTENMRTYWLHMLYSYREERDKPYSDDF